jgi:hypothetical protein
VTDDTDKAVETLLSGADHKVGDGIARGRLMVRTRMVAVTSRTWLGVVIAVVVAGGVVGSQGRAEAAPGLVPLSEVGAQPPGQAVTNLPAVGMPAAPQVAGQCAFQFDPFNPPPVQVKHVAPCGDPVNGTGAPDKPWGTIKQAMANLAPGDVAYVHDDPTLSVDYSEYDLTPARGGLGAPCPAGGIAAPIRIRLMAAPEEGRPTVAKPQNAPLNKPVLRLAQPWWLVEGLRLLGTGVQQHSVVVVQGGCIVLRRVEVTAAGTANAAVAFNGASNAALLDSHIWEPVAGDAVTGRPQQVPTSATDHHGVTVSGSSDRVLLRDNHSYGHNGDSVQCGEALATTPSTDPTNLTIEGNRYHQDEENAVDLKHCVRVTVRGNKFFGYYPARPLNTDRSPHGDALVVHFNSLAQPAERILIEGNRLFRNSRSINLSAQARSVAVRRNLIFDAKTDHCGIGAGILAAARLVEIYHNTLDLLPGPQAQPGSGCPHAWSASERAAIRLTNQSTTQPPVLWNNIVARAQRHLAAAITPSLLDAQRNLFDATPAGGTPAGSLIGSPGFISDPANNDYYTVPGSLARDNASPVSPGVGDPAAYCDDPGEPDALAEPDIGFLESCF